MTEFDPKPQARFVQLYEEHEDSLRLFVRSLLFSRDEEREVMQEVSAVLWQKFDASLDSSAFARWAFGVARMEVLSFRRDRARDRLTFGSEASELLAQTVVEQADALEAERRALEVCLKKLPSGQRALVQSAYAPGVKMDQLASQLGRTAMSLYKTLHRIRLTLMECTRRVIISDNLP